MKLAVCIPATDIVYVPFMMSMMALVNYLNKAPIGNRYVGLQYTS